MLFKYVEDITCTFKRDEVWGVLSDLASCDDRSKREELTVKLSCLLTENSNSTEKEYIKL